MSDVWKILAVIFLPLFGGIVAAVSFERTMGEHGRSEYEEWVLRSGIGLVLNELRPLPAEQRVERLQQLQPTIGIQMTMLTDSDPVPEGACGGSITSERLGGLRPHRLVYFPIDDDQCLRAGPMSMPQLPHIGMAIIGITSAVIAVLLASTIAVRQRRQIGVLTNAARTFGQGELEARINVKRLGSLATVGSQFNAMAQRLQWAFERREALLAAIAHELGTPTSRIRLAVGLMRDIDRPEDRARHLAGIGEDLDALESLAEEITTWLQAERTLDDQETSNFMDVVGELRDSPPENSEREIRLVAQDIPDVRIYGAERSVYRVLDNLVANAFRYANSKVAIGARIEGEDLRIEVRDDGPGVPRAQREQVFEPFMRLEPSRNRRGGGMGLGLAIVRRLAEGHGGRVSLGEAPEGGACFQVWWPLAT